MRCNRGEDVPQACFKMLTTSCEKSQAEYGVSAVAIITSMSVSALRLPCRAMQTTEGCFQLFIKSKVF